MDAQKWLLAFSGALFALGSRAIVLEFVPSADGLGIGVVLIVAATAAAWVAEEGL